MSRDLSALASSVAERVLLMLECEKLLSVIPCVRMEWDEIKLSSPEATLVPAESGAARWVGPSVGSTNILLPLGEAAAFESGLLTSLHQTLRERFAGEAVYARQGAEVRVEEDPKFGYLVRVGLYYIPKSRFSSEVRAALDKQSSRRHRQIAKL